MESLERLQGLHADLVALTQNSLMNIDRLLYDLKSSIDDFRALLDDAKSTAEEAKSLSEGKIEVRGQQYSVNNEFRHISNSISTALKISEEHAARLYIETQISVQATEPENEATVIADVVRKYHDRRDFLLQDLRILLAQTTSRDSDHDSEIYKELQGILKMIMGVGEASTTNGDIKFTKKCILGMDSIEKRQIELNDAIQSKQFLNQARGEAFYRTLEFQRSSLFKQHEALGAIVAYLFRGNHTDVENLKDLHAKSLKWQKLDLACIHYLPAFSAAFHQYGSTDKSTPSDARILNGIMLSKSPNAADDPYRPLAATLEMWWTAQYSSHYVDGAAPDPSADNRARIISKALDDGSLEFMLSICLNVSYDHRQHPARYELVQMLLEGSNITFEGNEQTSPFFITLVMEAYEGFVESWITNMPDSIRKLKSQEDERRLQQLTATSDGTLQRPPREGGPRLYLEAFLVLIAFAFHDRSDAAEQFWEDPDSNLYGFVQWASRRQTVPRVGAFCEMLSAIACSKENAENAHKFLLEDALPVLNMKGRKLPSMSYSQIFAELEFYARKVHEKSQPSQSTRTRSKPEPELNEVESPVMLCCYLRLLGHLCRYTSRTRQYILDYKELDLAQSLLALSSGPIPSYLRAGIFEFFEALLADNDLTVLDKVWFSIDGWASTNHNRATALPADKQQTPSLAALQNTLAAIASSHDQYDAFLKLLLALTRPNPGTANDLPFPSELGGTYRSPNIVPYVDLVCSQIKPENVRVWVEDRNVQGMLRLANSLDFINACLSGFNEDLTTLPDRPQNPAGSGQSFAVAYSQRHPFARVMQWIFSAECNRCLLDALTTFAEGLSTARPDHPTIRILEGVTKMLTHVIDLQSTYFDVVKPRIKHLDGYRVIQHSGMVSIEDSIMVRSNLLLRLCEFAASEHVSLALQTLALMTKLSESTRFKNHLYDKTTDRRAQNMLESIGTEGELKLANIAARLKDNFEIGDRELEAGEDSDVYLLRAGLISFFNACLSSQSDSPNLAHLLLGFSRISSRLIAGPSFESGTSLFDHLANICANYPDGMDNGILGWLTRLKSEGISVLRHLWTFPLSSELAMVQLRRADYLCQQISCQTVVSQSTQWDGITLADPFFYFTSAAETFTDFLSLRMHLYDYVNRELQLVARANMKAIQERYISSLQGKFIDGEGLAINHATALDLFDCAHLDTRPTTSLDLPDLAWFYDVNFNAYQKDRLFDVGQIRTLLKERSSSFLNTASEAKQPIDQESMDLELHDICYTFEAQNRYVLAQAEKLSCLHKYVDMVISIVNYCPMDPSTKTQFVLHMLQVIQPKLDTYLVDAAPESIELTRLADTLLLALSGPQLDIQRAQTRIDVSIAENLFQLFRVCAEGVQQAAINPDLRAVLYSICAQYLTRLQSSTSQDSAANVRARGKAMDTVRSAGPQLLSIVSDDADDGLDSCRLNALNFLAQLISLARSQKSNLLFEAFARLNTIEVLLDPIKTVADDFHATEPSNRHHLLKIFQARTLLLLQVSRTKAGAATLLDASLIQTLRDSRIFAADPDLGFDLNLADPSALVRSGSANFGRSTLRNTTASSLAAKTALTTYFTLLSDALRLLLSTFLSFGPDNEKAIFLIRTFLSDYRGNMVGVFKRAVALQQAQDLNFLQAPAASNTNGGDGELTKLVNECAKAYTGLAIGSGFLEYEDEEGLGGNAITGGLGRSQFGAVGFT